QGRGDQTRAGGGAAPGGGAPTAAAPPPPRARGGGAGGCATGPPRRSRSRPDGGPTGRVHGGRRRGRIDRRNGRGGRVRGGDRLTGPTGYGCRHRYAPRRTRAGGRSPTGTAHQPDTPCLVSSVVNFEASLSSSVLGSEPQLATIALIDSDEDCRNGVQSGMCGKYRPP